MNLSSILPNLNFSGDWMGIGRTALIFAILLFAVGAVIRLTLGQGSPLSRAVSASLSVILVYLFVLILYRFLPEVRTQLAQLPFVYADHRGMALSTLSGLPINTLCGGLMRLALLSFLVNLLESILPEGQTFPRWFGWRCIMVVLSLSLYNFFCIVLEAALPELFGAWAKYVLLCFWVFILLSGALKVLLGVVLTVINPVVGALYAFFFSHIVGSQFSKSILTTLILTALVAALNYLGLTSFVFATFSLLAYAPACVIAFLTLYLFGKIL